MLGRRVLFFLVLAMGVFAPPQIQAQAPSAQPPAPATAAPQPLASAEDRSIELAFWNSVQAMNECEAYKAYQARYPDGAFSVLARLGERRACAGAAAPPQPAPPAATATPATPPGERMQPALLVAPPVADAPQRPEPSAGLNATAPAPNGPSAPGPDAELVRAVQAELKRVNCGDMDASGEWTKDTEDAVARFNEHARWRFDFQKPSEALLSALARSGEFACALDCIDGYRADGGACVPLAASAPAAPLSPATSANRRKR